MLVCVFSYCIWEHLNPSKQYSLKESVSLTQIDSAFLISQPFNISPKCSFSNANFQP